MNRTFSLLLALALLLTLPLSLAAENAVINEVFNKEQMLNIHGELVTIDDLNNLVFELDFGYAFMVPEHMNGLDENSAYPMTMKSGTLGYVYLPKPIHELYLSRMTIETEEEFEVLREKILAGDVPLFCVMRSHPDQEFNEETLAENKEEFQHMELLAVRGEDEIYLFYNTSLAFAGLSEEEEQPVRDFLEQGIELVRKGLMVYPPADYYDHFGYYTEEIPLNGGVEAFASQDLYGNDFSPEEFAKYDLTMVNVWFTDCGLCVDEMPELQQLKEALPDNINLITVCLDGEKENELAKAIVEGVGATFTTLKGDELGRGVLKNVTATPTTLFISRSGMQLGEAIIGAMGSKANFVEQSLTTIYQRLGLLPQE